MLEHQLPIVMLSDESRDHYQEDGYLQSWKKLMAKRQKTALCLTPQAMYNQFKRPSARIVSELYYICRKT